MKYLKTYEQVKGHIKWGMMYEKLIKLFNIVGYKFSYFPSMSGVPLTLNLNLISTPGSISYCIIQSRMQEYKDLGIETKYEDPKNTLYPKDDTECKRHNAAHKDDEPEKSYPIYIGEIIELLKTFSKARIDTALDIHITDIIELQIAVLQSNINYDSKIIIPEEVCYKLLTYIDKYNKPNKLISDMKNNVPLLYSEMEKILGSDNLDNSRSMHGMGFSD